MKTLRSFSDIVVLKTHYKQAIKDKLPEAIIKHRKTLLDAARHREKFNRAADKTLAR